MASIVSISSGSYVMDRTSSAQIGQPTYMWPMNFSRLFRRIFIRTGYLRMTLFPRLGVAGISTPWPFRYSQPVKMSINIAPTPRLSGTGMTSLDP